MTGFDLLFLLGAGLTLVALATVLVLALAGRRRRAGRLLAALAGGWIAYLLVVGITAALTPQRVYAPGEPQCFDDMCFTVTGAANQGPTIAVTVRISNHARRVTEGEGGLRAQLWEGGRLHEAVTGRPPLSVRLAPGASADSVQIFDNPGGSATLALVLNHGFTPGCFVIGECPWFHPATIMPLPVESAAGHGRNYEGRR